MDVSDITVEILKSIRDEVKSAREGLGQEIRGVREDLVSVRDELRSEIRGTNLRLDTLERRQVETETRLASELVGVAHVMGEVRDLLRDRLDLRDDVRDLDRRVTALEKVLGA